MFHVISPQVTLDPGDILVVNTNWWFHQTKVGRKVNLHFCIICIIYICIFCIIWCMCQVLPGDLSITVTSEFD